MSNAIKFTPIGGRIWLNVVVNELGDVVFKIRDTGIGMPKHILNNLFDINEKTNRPGTNNEPSSGFGLILSKDFIEMHGGKIWVESEVGAGSTFYINVPRLTGQQAEEIQKTALNSIGFTQ